MKTKDACVIGSLYIQKSCFPVFHSPMSMRVLFCNCLGESFTLKKRILARFTTQEHFQHVHAIHGTSCFQDHAPVFPAHLHVKTHTYTQLSNWNIKHLVFGISQV